MLGFVCVCVKFCAVVRDWKGGLLVMCENGAKMAIWAGFSYKQKQARNRRQSTQHRATGCAELSLRLRFSESPSNSAAIKTKISPIEAKERKLWMIEEGRLIFSLESRQHRPDQSPQTPKRLILPSPSGDFNGSAQLQNLFSTQDAGRFK